MLKKVGKISEKSESSSSQDTPGQLMSPAKRKKYFNFISNFQDENSNIVMEKKSCPMIKVNVTNNFMNNHLESIKERKDDPPKNNWLVESVMGFLGCGCADKKNQFSP